MQAASAVNFDTAIPEAIRGVAFPKKPVNWEALKLVVDSMDCSPEEKKEAREELFQIVRERGVGPAMMPRLRLSYVRARLMLGDFTDYWGWEFRGAYDQGESRTWAADCFWSETWMPKWGGGNVPRLLVLAEQGIGDEVFIASMLPEALVRAQEVIFECSERLHKLLKRSFPTNRLKVMPERDFEDRRKDYGKIDAFVPGMDLMRMFRRDISHFPGKEYLKPDPVRVSEFESYRGRVGIAWSGRQGSIDPHKLGIDRAVSIQYKAKSLGIEEPWLDLFDDIDGVVALCSVLEKVVCVPQSVMHFAGASGVRVEVVWPEIKGVENNFPFDWGIRYNAGKLPWYPNVQTYPSLEDWKSRTKKPSAIGLN